LRNRLVHEYVDAPERLLQALLAALNGVALLQETQARLAGFADRHGWTGG